MLGRRGIWLANAGVLLGENQFAKAGLPQNINLVLVPDGELTLAAQQGVAVHGIMRNSRWRRIGTSRVKSRQYFRFAHVTNNLKPANGVVARP